MRSRVYLFWLIVVMSHSVFSQTLSTQIEQVIEQNLPYATIAIVVKDGQTGEVIYSRNPNTLVTPASSIKLFTAAAALYHLHPHYRFITSLAQKSSNIYLTFRGAPDFTIENLTQLLEKLKISGIESIEGNLVLDVSRFQPPYQTAGTSYDDLGWYYASPETALILQENAADYKFIADKIGLPVQIHPLSDSIGLTILNNVVIVNSEQEKNHCELHVETQSNNTVHLFGCLAQNAAPVMMHLAIPDPILLAKQHIAHYLKQNNIALKGHIVTGRTPEDATLIAQHSSQNLAQLITHMLQKSDNLYASSLTRTLGYALTKEGSNKQGAFALKTILAQHTHVDVNQIEIVDGIGTRYNLASAQQIVTLLTDLYADPTMKPLFLQALPQAAISGTLQSRMKNTPLEKIVRAKTGTMHDISSLSGYLLDPQGTTLIFSIIMNGIHAPINTAKSLEEKILTLIYQAKRGKSDASI